MLNTLTLGPIQIAFTQYPTSEEPRQETFSFCSYIEQSRVLSLMVTPQIKAI